MIVNGVQFGFCACDGAHQRDIELAENEKVVYLEYQKIHSGTFPGNICNFRLKTNFGNYHPNTGYYGTGCWTTDVTQRSYEVPDDASFLDFLKTIASPPPWAGGYMTALP